MVNIFKCQYVVWTSNFTLVSEGYVGGTIYIFSVISEKLRTNFSKKYS